MVKLRTLLRYGGFALVVAVVVLTIALLALRFVLLPQLEAHPERVAAFLSEKIGQPVTVGEIETGWSGWNPWLTARQVRLFNGEQNSAHDNEDKPSDVTESPSVTVRAPETAQMTLPAMMMQLSTWRSLLHAEVRFRTLRFEKPELKVWRDAADQLYVGGMRVTRSPSGAASGQGESGAAFPDWLLEQQAIEIDEGTLVWQDALRPSAPLTVEHLNFRAEQTLGQYRFGVRGAIANSVVANDTVAPAAGSVATQASSADERATFDVRGSTARGLLSGSLNQDWRFYVKLDRVDLNHLQQWIDLPVTELRGVGSVQGWATVAQRRLESVTLDVALQDVHAHLSDDVPDAATAQPLVLKTLQGRLMLRNVRDKMVFSAQGVSLTGEGLELAPTDVTLTLEGLESTAPKQPAATAKTSTDNGATDSSTPSFSNVLARAARGRIEFNRLDLVSLAALARHVPLTEAWREKLTQLGIHGVLEKGSGDWTRAPASTQAAAGAAVDDAAASIKYRAQVDLQGVRVNRFAPYPGIDGVSGHLSLDETQGTLVLDSRALTIDIPDVFAEALQLERLDGNVRWQQTSTGLTVQLEKIRFSNADAEGVAEGHWQAAQNGGPGHIDLQAELGRADPRAVYRYLPHVAGENTRRWLQASLKSGKVEHAKLVLKGNLEHFPFADGKQGTFVVDARAAGVRLVYDPLWPGIDGINADLRFEGESMTVTAKRGTMFDAALGTTKAVIPNLGADHPHLLIDGTANGATATYLRFLDESPVGGWLNNMLAGTKATGNGKLALQLDIPLNGDATSKVSGSYQLVDNALRIVGAPALAHVRGTVVFTEHDVKADRLTFEALGGPGEVALASGSDGGVTLKGSGTADVAAVKTEYPAPLLDRVSGQTPWQLTLSTSSNLQQGVQWVIDTPLEGVAIDLPAPLGKAAATSTPLRVAHSTSTQGNEEEARWAVSYAPLGMPLQLDTWRKLGKNESAGDRLVLTLGEAKAQAGNQKTVQPPTPGLWVRGTLPVLDLDPWLFLYKSLPADAWASTSTGESPTLQGINVTVGKFGLMGRQIHDADIAARVRGGVWGIQLKSREAEGAVTWENTAASSTTNGRLKGTFSKLTFPEAGELSPWTKDTNTSSQKPAKTSNHLEAGSANPWPAIDFSVDHFIYKDNDLGHLSLKAAPQGMDWRIENMVLTNDDGHIEGDGWWRVSGDTQHTEVKIAAQVSDVEKLLARFGVPRSIVATDAKLDGMLSWADSPSDFDLQTLNGQLALQVGDGHFTKIEPGIGRLLGVLSLQALPRRITLDFRDVFSEGFAFDAITGHMTIASGILHTDDLLLNGAAAKVKLDGDVDLAQETQSLNVYVQPSLTDGLSMGAAGASILLMTNPVSAAAVGIGALVGQIALGNPIEKIFSYEYVVKGSWSDPQVEKKGREGLPGLSHRSKGSSATTVSPKITPATPLPDMQSKPVQTPATPQSQSQEKALP